MMRLESASAGAARGRTRPKCMSRQYDRVRLEIIGRFGCHRGAVVRPKQRPERHARRSIERSTN